MVCKWFGEICYCSCLPVLSCPAWVLLGYVMQTIFHYPVHSEHIQFHCSDLKAKYRVTGIPTVIAVTGDGRLISRSGRSEIGEMGTGTFQTWITAAKTE